MNGCPPCTLLLARPLTLSSTPQRPLTPAQLAPNLLVRNLISNLVDRHDGVLRSRGPTPARSSVAEAATGAAQEPDGEARGAPEKAEVGDDGEHSEEAPHAHRDVVASESDVPRLTRQAVAAAALKRRAGAGQQDVE